MLTSAQVRAVKRFKQLLFRRRPERLEGILGSASRIVQPPLSMRPSGLRKSKSQDTDDRRPIEGALTTEGVHRDIDVDDDVHRVPRNVDEMAYSKPGNRSALAGSRSSQKSATTSSPLSPQPISGMDAKVIHDNMSYRPPVAKPIAIPSTATSSAPTTPLGKGHAHDPLQDTLFLNIGTGEDSAPAAEDTNCIVSESPGAVDINVYETAYREEVDRIVKRREASTPGRRPTLYLTRRVENVKSIVRDHDHDLIFDHGKSPAEVKQDLKGGFKSFVEKAKKEIEARGELQKLTEGKEGKLSRITRNVREKKRLVEEEREIIRREDRERERERVAGKERSRSSTPVAGLRGSSRSATPVTPVMAEK
jgi:[calcium/calmodulin-dependent protein kinase] kinase